MNSKPIIYIYRAQPHKGEHEDFNALSHTEDEDKWVVTLENESTREFSKTEFKKVWTINFMPFDPKE